MTTIEEIKEDAVKHYGTKGMKWGVRKKRSRSSESSTVAKLKKKKAFELSNEELKKVNARLNLEKQYSQLNPSALSKVAKSVSSVVGSIAKSTATELGTKYAKKILDPGS